ncbi:hypothetical protein ACHAXT_007240 [Thalassiosira profunda]
MKATGPLSALLAAAPAGAFVLPSSPSSIRCTDARPSASSLAALDPEGIFSSDLFEDDEDMVPVAEAYIHAKYKAVASSHGHDVATTDDVKEVLHSILPPVTPAALAKEEEAILQDLLGHAKNTPEAIDEDDFVKSIFKNSYWKEAGDIVVKELIYFDSLHSYYSTGKPLLNNDLYDELHENLTWEGSSVATMSAREAQFVSAVAASKRGEPLMNDAEYKELKAELKREGSWVVNRKEDSLERLGLNTFMGYLHRSMVA